MRLIGGSVDRKIIVENILLPLLFILRVPVLIIVLIFLLYFGKNCGCFCQICCVEVLNQALRTVELGAGASIKFFDFNRSRSTLQKLVYERETQGKADRTISHASVCCVGG